MENHFDVFFVMEE